MWQNRFNHGSSRSHSLNAFWVAHQILAMGQSEIRSLNKTDLLIVLEALSTSAIKGFPGPTLARHYLYRFLSPNSQSRFY